LATLRRAVLAPDAHYAVRQEAPWKKDVWRIGVRTAEAADATALRDAITTTLAHPDHEGRRGELPGCRQPRRNPSERYDRAAHDWQVAGFVECHMRVDDNLSIRDVGTTGDEPQTGVVRYFWIRHSNSQTRRVAGQEFRRDASNWQEIFRAIRASTRGEETAARTTGQSGGGTRRASRGRASSATSTQTSKPASTTPSTPTPPPQGGRPQPPGCPSAEPATFGPRLALTRWWSSTRWRPLPVAALVPVARGAIYTRSHGQPTLARPFSAPGTGGSDTPDERAIEAVPRLFACRPDLSPNTVSAFERSQHLPTFWSPSAAPGRQRLALASIDRDLISAYFLHLRDRGYSSASIARKTPRCDRSSSTCVAPGAVASDQRGIGSRSQKALPRTIRTTTCEGCSVLRAPRYARGSARSAMLRLLSATGMRVGELVMVDVDDIDCRMGACAWLDAVIGAQFAARSGSPSTASRVPGRARPYLTATGTTRRRCGQSGRSSASAAGILWIMKGRSRRRCQP